LASVLFLSGCGIVSLHPLYRYEDLVVKTDLIGTWKNVKEQDTFITIDTIDNKKYQFVLVIEGDTLDFEMGLIRLNGQYFIDLYPGEKNTCNCESLELIISNYIHMHTFMKLDITEDGISLTEFDNERLTQLFRQNRIRLAYEQQKNSDIIVITASTGDLQKFIARYADDDEAFKESDNYKKLKS
jgi:hypothetical protein